MKNNFKPNENFIYYLYFIVERMNIFYKRYNGEQPPYTEDEILRDHKFTNVYRVLDRVSQYLVKEIINKDKEFDDIDLFWRILLFKHFNEIETWEWLEKDLGIITIDIPIDDIVESLNKKINTKGGRIYSNAFLQTAPFMGSEKFMSSFGLEKGCSKHKAYLTIFYEHFINRGNLEPLLESKSMEGLFLELRKVPGFADFLSMQYCTDFNWSRLFDFDPNSFISASVGSVRGIDKGFSFIGKKDYSAVIMWINENIGILFKEYSDAYDLPLNFVPLKVGGNIYMPTVMDWQNCLCEYDKYTRPLGIETGKNSGAKKRIKQKFTQTSNKLEIHLPNKWLNK